MQYCEHCKLNIRDNKKNCPLCQNELPKPTGTEKEVFPKVPIRYNRHMAIRILIFISISIIVFSYGIYLLFPVNINWPMYVISVIACIWIILIIAIRKRHNISKSIMWQVAVISLLAVLWDWRMGFLGWSINYVIPLTCLSAMVVFIIIAKIMHVSPREYLVYLLIDVLYGLIPIIFILFKWVDVLYPSIISITVSIISLAALILFQGDNILDELKKRMHV